MNTIETIMLGFFKNELTKNPTLAGDFLDHILSQTKIDPTLEKDLVALVTQLLPMILQSIK